MTNTLAADLAAPFDARALRRRLDEFGELTGVPPTRQRLAELAASHPTPGDTPVALRVWRNHAIEPLAPQLHAFARSAGYSLSISPSDYDDSLSLLELDRHHGRRMIAECGPVVHLVWFDLTRSTLPAEQRAPWLAERLEELAALTASHVVAVVVDHDEGQSSGDHHHDGTVARARAIVGSRVHLFSLTEFVADGAVDDPIEAAAASLGLVDPRLVALAGTQVSRTAQLQAARALALRYIPALARAPRKLVFVDLDDTLHHGILGELDLEVRVTPGHRRLQQALVDAHQRGTMLAIVSKNDAADVARLLAEHPDYVLRAHHLVAVEASWRPKADAITDVLAQVNIDASAALFIDDNFAELATVAARHPSLGLVDAGRGPVATLRTLELTPGLFRLGTDAAADVRSIDVRANADRSALLDGGRRVEAYLAAAAPRVTFRLDHPGDAERLADLGLRTNQFNLALARRDLAAFSTAIATPGRCVVAAEVSDRFSDSGTVLGVLVEHDEVVDVFLSCRVLGRGLEDAMLAAALLAAARHLHLDRLHVHWVRGPRNDPAREWLERLAGRVLEGDRGIVTIAGTHLEQAAVPATGVEHTMSEQR